MDISKIVFLTHPKFLGHQSMPRFAQLLIGGFRKRGYLVEEWTPSSLFFRLGWSVGTKKWLGYLDQYVLFPIYVKLKLLFQGNNVLYVFTDHALGPWVPLCSDRPHVIHCHDFLAQDSAFGSVTENPTSKTGVWYQKYIQHGYSKGKYFISVSDKTRLDLNRFHLRKPVLSERVYNALNQDFFLRNKQELRQELFEKYSLDLENGFILHVGGNQWYKNRKGVIEIYEYWRQNSNVILPLIMVGAEPTKDLLTKKESSGYSKDIFFLVGIPDLEVKMFYSAATLLLFPSLAEGFGWPIIEAMASGCPVITLEDDPMKEVGGDAAFYISSPRKTSHERFLNEGAILISKILNLNVSELNEVIDGGLSNVSRFSSSNFIDSIEFFYKKVAKEY